jgi:hypothetical protein
LLEARARIAGKQLFQVLEIAKGELGLKAKIDADGTTGVRWRIKTHGMYG